MRRVHGASCWRSASEHPTQSISLSCDRCTGERGIYTTNDTFEEKKKNEKGHTKDEHEFKCNKNNICMIKIGEHHLLLLVFSGQGHCFK